MRRALVTSFVLILAALLLTPTASLAKKKRRSAPPTTYSVPFTCGQNADLVDGVVPGDHVFTAYVSNGSAYALEIQQVVAITYPPGGGVAGPVSMPVLQTLDAMVASQITCSDLLGGVFMYDDPPDTSTYVQGILRITSLRALTVTAQQSVIGASGDVALMEAPVSKSTGAMDDEAKITLCHVPPGNPGNAKTLSVGASSWPAHEAHGDSMGACP